MKTYYVRRTRVILRARIIEVKARTRFDALRKALARTKAGDTIQLVRKPRGRKP